MEKVVIIDALRTPIGKFRGSLAEFQAVDLGTIVSKELMERNKKIVEAIDYVAFGQVLQAGVGQNSARQVALMSGLPVSVPAVTLNEVCGSGMKAIAHARQLLQLGEARVVLAGGMESMTNAPSVSHYSKETDSYSNPRPSMVVDGLTDAFSGKHMGLTAENVAKKYDVSREEQDQFSYNSQQKAKIAIEKGWFENEIIPVKLNSGTYFSQDEGVRPQTSLEKLSELRTVFKENEGTVTAGNASTINDGASAMLLCNESFAIENDLEYIAIIEDIVEVAIDPEIMGISPISAIKKLLDRSKLPISQVDLFEINEAFAASSIVVERELNLDLSKVNIAGGGISLGHAIGASGARIVTTLINQLERTNKEVGIASLCVGGGIGLAMLLRLPKKKDKSTDVKAFYKQTPDQRRQTMFEKKLISIEQKNLLTHQNLPEDISNHLIENQISDFSLPMGLALNLVLEGKEFSVPMVTEEPSVVAACSNGAKMASFGGGFKAEIKERLLRGQIVFSKLEDVPAFAHIISLHQEEIKEIADASYPSIVNRGGGFRYLEIRTFEEEPTYLSVDLLFDTKEAMGANMINTVLETVSKSIQTWTNEAPLINILSNYATEALVNVSCKVPFSSLSKESNGKEIALKIEQASVLAQIDPYRAVTHNKGILNGLEAFVLATGNDTRAMAAAAHAYASKSGQYRGLSQWKVNGEYLEGNIEMPLILASVGGAVKILPKAKIVHAILGNPTAKQLGMIGGAVGLAQNLAALRALVSEGIQKGHMSLHARSLAMSVGALNEEVQVVADLLKKSKSMNQESAKQILSDIRHEYNE